MESAKPAELQFGGTAEQAKAQAAPLPWTSEEITTPYTQAPTSTHGKVFFTATRRRLRLLRHRAAERQQVRGLDRGPLRQRGPGRVRHQLVFVPAYKDGAAPRHVAENLLPPRAGATRATSATTSARRLSRRRWHGAHRPCRWSRDRVQLGPRPELPVLRLSGRAAVRRRAPVALRLGAAEQRHAANPPTLGIGCDMTGGSSGGGWIVGSNVVTVNSYGYDDQPDVMYGPYQGTRRAIALHRGSSGLGDAARTGRASRPPPRWASLDGGTRPASRVERHTRGQPAALLRRHLEVTLPLGGRKIESPAVSKPSAPASTRPCRPPSSPGWPRGPHQRAAGLASHDLRRRLGQLGDQRQRVGLTFIDLSPA